MENYVYFGFGKYTALGLMRGAQLPLASNLDVLVEISNAGESDVAKFTLERFLARVTPHMGLEVRLPYVCLLAAGVGAFEALLYVGQFVHF